MATSSLDSNARKFLNGAAATEAIRIIGKLREAGFVAYLAGGCVRDALLGKPPKDFDVATDATPDSIREVFGRRRTLAFGASFGVIGVLPPTGTNRGIKSMKSDDSGRSEPPSDVEGRDDLRGDNVEMQRTEPTEVATFRSDGFYSDGRRPDSVHFGDARNDALRRDFTINGLFYDPLQHQLIDYVNGQQDLQAGILRTIGDPVLRFGEDKLRMLRAVRFATTISLTIEPLTLEAIIHHADDIVVVSGERIGAEMRRVLAHPKLLVGLDHLHRCRLDEHVLPELCQIDRSLVSQRFARLRHCDIAGGDIAGGDIAGRDFAEWDFAIALALLVATIDAADGRPRSVPAEWVDRWKLSGEETRKANAALKRAPVLLQADSLPWSVVQPAVIDRDIETILALATALAESETERNSLKRVIEALQLPGEELNPPPLLTGNDLRKLGIPPGPEIGRLLKMIRNAQLDQEIHSPEEAIARINM